MDVPVPPMGAGLIEIRVEASEVCDSDIHMWKAGKGWGAGDMSNFIMGHEYCGVVTDPGDSSFKVGDRVTFWANLYCRKWVSRVIPEDKPSDEWLFGDF